MKKIAHGKIPKWYDDDAKNYDAFNENTPVSIITNKTLEKILKKYRVKTIGDFTCGTGSQVFWFANRGYQLSGADISSEMLKVAKQKAKKNKMNIKLIKGDMRNIQLGQFDAAMTISNAIGHLTKSDFEKTLRNIHRNLNPQGIYVFDNFNLDYFRYGDNISTLTIDWIRCHKNKSVRYVQHSVLNKDGVLISYTTHYMQQKSGKLSDSKSIGTLQLYAEKEFKKILEKNGFKLLEIQSIEGKKFFPHQSERMVVVARKN